MSRPLRTVAILLTAVPVAMLAACSTTAEVKTYSFPVDPGTTMLAVDVQNFRGSVSVRTGGPGSDAEVEAEFNAVPGVKKSKAEELQSGTSVEATLEQADGRGVLRVVTTNPDDTERLAAQIVVRVPRCDGLRIINRGGGVEAVGTRGATEIQNRNGGIEFRTNHIIREDLTVLNTDGSIYIQIPLESTGKVDLESLEGQTVLRDYSGNAGEMIAAREAIRTTIGDATNSITARTNLGEIRMWVMEEPEKLTRIWKVPIPNPSDSYFLDGSRRFTRNLPDDEPRQKSQATPGIRFPPEW